MDDVCAFLDHCDWLTPLCGPRCKCAIELAWIQRKHCRTFQISLYNACDFPGLLMHVHDLIENDDRLPDAIYWSAEYEVGRSGTFWICVRVAYEPRKKQGHVWG